MPLPESKLLGERSHSFFTQGVDRLVVDEVFRENQEAEAPIGWVSNNFRRIFSGKVEGETPAGDLTLRPLLEASKDDPIIGALGGKEKARVSLADLYVAMRHLGRPNQVVWVVGYVPDPEDLDTLWAVIANWRPGLDDWRVEALSVEPPAQGLEGSLFLSRPPVKRAMSESPATPQCRSWANRSKEEERRNL